MYGRRVGRRRLRSRLGFPRLGNIQIDLLNNKNITNRTIKIYGDAGEPEWERFAPILRRLFEFYCARGKKGLKRKKKKAKKREKRKLGREINELLRDRIESISPD